MKSPQFSRHISEFAAVFPEATFVVTHRDPYRCTVSVAALCHALGGAFLHDNPLEDDGHRSRSALAQTRGALAAIASFAASDPARISHVRYPELVSSPAQVVANVLGADLDEPVELFLAAQRAGRRAAPPDHLDTMGYDHDDVWSDPGVADYVSRFDVSREERRLTGS